MARLDAGAITLEQAPEKVFDLLEHIKRQYSFRAEQEGKEIVLEGDGQTVFSCDRTWRSRLLKRIRAALKDVSFSVPKGEFVAIVGESGSGKNTLLNMIFPLLLDRQRPNGRYLDELLSVLGLEQRRGHLPSQLSGGQQQRVAIGRALMTRPSLVLADEPTGNLDSQNSSEVLVLLNETARKYEQAVIMITHNPAIAHTADRVFQVSDGVLTDLGGCRA